MFLRILVIYLIFGLSYGSAKTISVISQQTQFTLDIDKESSIKLKGYLMNLSMTKNKCNEKIFLTFINRINLLLTAKVMSTTKELNTFMLKVDDKEYFENPKSKMGYNILSIPKEFQRIKIEEKILCGRK